jgi:hypothetical protein
MNFLQASSFFKIKSSPVSGWKINFLKTNDQLYDSRTYFKDLFHMVTQSEGGLIHKRQSNKSRRPLGALLEFTFGMYFSEGPNFLLVRVKILLVGVK